ncbi:exported hypothetical protein [uncultured Desulfatiglans sp.]|nr:exported hypothetical protein [uncultured Desulfatiglans sp.]
MKKIFYCFLVLLLAVGFAAGNAMATSYDPIGKAGIPMTAPPTPMLWNHGNMGDALFGELYRGVSLDEVGDLNFVTFFTIENTSNYWVAAHVRLRAGRYSIEVKDFPILLSPRDVFWMQYQPVFENGELVDIVLWSADTKTLKYSGLVPWAAPDGTTWTKSLDTGLLEQFSKMRASYGWTEQSDLWLETTQGHVEVFGLFAFRASPAAVEGNTVQGLMGKLYANVAGSANCTEADANAYVTVDYNGYTDIFFSDVQNYLMGQVYLGDFSNGVYMGYPMRAIQNFRAQCTDFVFDQGFPVLADNEGPVHRDDIIRGWFSPRGIIVYGAYEDDPAYTDPDWATSFGPTWNDGDDWIHDGHRSHELADLYVQSYSLDEVDDAIIKSDIWGTYFNNTNNDTYTMAAVTFPTKYLHQFYDILSGLQGGVGQSAIYSYLKGSVGAWPVGFPADAQNVRQRLDVVEYALEMYVRFGLWDWNERPCRPEGSPFPNIRFPWEVTLVPIGAASQDALEKFCFLTLNTTDDCIDAPANIFPGGLFHMFNIVAAGADPRNYDYGGGYSEDYLQMRNAITPNYQPTMLFLNEFQAIPASVLLMDFNFENYDHSRALDPSWDNPGYSNATAGN